jgi:hypothetical protein
VNTSKISEHNNTPQPSQVKAIYTFEASGKMKPATERQIPDLKPQNRKIVLVGSNVSPTLAS